jgi:plasmid replication initiation protein
MPKNQDLSNNLVVKSNDLVMAIYALSVNEQRIFLSCLSQVDSREILERDALFTLTVEQARDLFYTRGDQRNAYRDLKQASRRLFERKAKIDLGDGQELLTRFVQSVKFDNKAEEVRLRFAYDLIPYLSQLEQNFTQYRLSNVVQLTSSHAIRIYELLVSWAGQGVLFKEMDIDEFRNLLALDGKYQKISELKARVIEPSLAQINDSTDFELDISFRKVRRAFRWIQLRFNRKPEAARADAEAKAARLERQAHNAAAKAKREAEEKALAAERKKQAAHERVKEYFGRIPKGTKFELAEDGTVWEFDGNLLQCEAMRTAMPLPPALGLIESGALVPHGGSDQEERERLEREGQRRLVD